MWPQDGKLNISCGLKKHEFFKEWKWIRCIDAPKVFHARIGTHGKGTLENCHPFFIPNHGALGVAHNGIITKCADQTSDKSDTLLFVENVLAKMPQGFAFNPAIQEVLSEYIGASKLVFMDGKGKVVITNPNLGYWVGDMWYSNKSYISWVASPKEAVCGFTPSTNNDYTLLPSKDYVQKALPLGAPENGLPEHYKNIGASKGLSYVPH
jgi:hypothetical protein